MTGIEKGNRRVNNPVQTALVLQGGGALAAYEAGVYCALYFWIKKNFVETDNKNIFDIIAGTSGGAINAAIIVSHVQHRRKEGFSIKDSWQGSLRKLLDFWNYTSSTPDFSIWRPFFSFLWPLYGDEKSWISLWNERNGTNKRLATGESARRYYSTKEFLYHGAPHVFSSPSSEFDDRFIDNFFTPSNIWLHYKNEELRKSIEKYTEFPIATTFDRGSDKEKQQPRLLVVSTDVREGEAVTFDSYEKQDGGRRSQYGDYIKGADRATAIRYNEGLMIEHIMASSSVPVHYKYAMVPVNYGHESTESRREFWDGGILSNTPLRELIQSHEDYWNEMDGSAMPDLKVYIVDIWPHKGDAPLDHDGIMNRRYDLTYQEKTPHEEKIAYLISDYIDLVFGLIKKSKIPQHELDDFLDKTYGRSKHRDGELRTYQQLLRKVRITDVVRLERNPDPNEISYKWCDYSADTVTAMIKQGIEETLYKMSKIIKNSNGDSEDACIELDKFITLIDAEKENELLTEKLDRILNQSTPSDLLKKSAIHIKKEVKCE
ncbi:MAG: patatin-like phospholipase family protein [Nitrososphaerota archaeon]